MRFSLYVSISIIILACCFYMIAGRDHSRLPSPRGGDAEVAVQVQGPNVPNTRAEQVDESEPGRDLRHQMAPATTSATITDAPNRPVDLHGRPLVPDLAAMSDDDVVATFAKMLSPPRATGYAPLGASGEWHEQVESEMSQIDPDWSPQVTQRIWAAIKNSTAGRQGRDRVVDVRCGRTICEVLSIGTVADSGIDGVSFESLMISMAGDEWYRDAGMQDVNSVNMANDNGTAILHAVYFTRTPPRP